MRHSDDIKDLATALAKAQAAMTGARKDSTNPHFRSNYADLASVREASVPALNKFEIAVVQSPRLVQNGAPTVQGTVEAWLVEVETTLIHASGQWLADTLAVPVTQANAQGVGSAITYARRYALAAVAGVAPEDDDGEAAVGRTAAAKQAVLPATALATTMTIKVAKITKKPSGAGFKFLITDIHGTTYATFREPLAVLAKDAQAAGALLDVTFKAGQYGSLDIVELVEARPEPAL